MQDGILVIDKPRGMTSADVVARVKRALRARRCGHTGTLDPMATGVLPIALDEGTKAAAFLLRDDKTYEGELELGVTTDTLDAEGAVTGRADPGDVSAETLRAAFAAWVGDREQIPPMYSALKHGGKRLYELARAGVEVDRPARRIRIDRLELQWFRPPHARFVVDCQKGTYVRALVRDIGAAVGCGATLTSLRRTRAGRFTLADAVTLHRAAEGRVIPLAEVLADLPAVTVVPECRADVQHGRPIPAPQAAPAGPLRILGPDGALLAVGEADAGKIRYLRVFLG
ncbi:MAG TPA: tRNA pseudouridine(55) synthase TruB [Haliangiales bacterium]|nr:tRNA pseudouridine(55) synthase TruB [Haliangiales bacterium]